MSGLGHRLTDLGFAAGWRLTRTLPEGLARWGFRTAADLAARRDGPGVRQLRRNLARVVPQAGREELDELVRDALRSYARYWRETFRLPGMDLAEVRGRVDELFVGKSLLGDALARGKGLIVVLPHTGNWDIAGIWLVDYSGPFTTVQERLKPESLYDRFVAYRQSLGFEILPASGGNVAPYRVLIERLRANKVVCLPADRDLSRRGVPVTFFGEETRMPAGPARLAAMTGARIVVLKNTFTEDGWAMGVHTPIDVHSKAEVATVTQRIADGFAADIAAKPADWHMVQPLWIADLPEKRRKSLSAPVLEPVKEETAR
jgi:phosphatidylinositol dimannoside acyltransferase